MNLPVNFADLAKAANSSASGAYPYSLKGADLDKNFNAVAIDIPTSWVSGAANGQRILNLPPVPSSGTHVLGAANGVLSWIATEEC